MTRLTPVPGELPQTNHTKCPLQPDTVGPPTFAPVTVISVVSRGERPFQLRSLVLSLSFSPGWAILKDPKASHGRAGQAEATPPRDTSGAVPGWGPAARAACRGHGRGHGSLPGTSTHATGSGRWVSPGLRGSGAQPAGGAGGDRGPGTLPAQAGPRMLLLEVPQLALSVQDSAPRLGTVSPQHRS